jgi:hypothetical protein
MTFEWEMKYCERASCMYGSMTRQLMHLIADPEEISFGGRLPAWELFPVEQVKESSTTSSTAMAQRPCSMEPQKGTNRSDELLPKGIWRRSLISLRTTC